MAVTVAPVVAESPVDGAQVYVPEAPAPEAVSDVLLPAQIDTGDGVTVIVGIVQPGVTVPRILI